MKEKKQTREVMSWTEHPVWLEAFQQPIPENLATPAEIAAFEAERFAADTSACFGSAQGMYRKSEYQTRRDLSGRNARHGRPLV